MKVLVLAEQGDRNRYTERLIPLMRTRGIDVHFGTIGPRGYLHDKLEDQEIPTIALGWRSARNYPSAVLGLARIIRRNKFDVVHSCEAIPSAIGGVSATIAGVKPRIYHRHHVVAEGAAAWKWNLLSRIATKSSDVVMGVSKAVVEAACEHDGVPKSRTFLAYNGVESLRKVFDNELIELRRRLGIPSNDAVISIVAKLRQVKGHRTLFAAASILARRLDRGLHVVVVGSGTEENALREMAETVSGAKIHFVGNQDDVAPWFSVADVVAMPSYREPFGLVAIEAMMCGRPLVASRVDGLVEIVEHDKTGILVEPGDAEALADGLARVLSDADLAARLGANGRAEVEARFSIESMVQNWIDCYEFALSAVSR